MQRIFAIAWLTWKAALRFRLFLVIAVLLLAAVVGLPLVHQGRRHGARVHADYSDLHVERHHGAARAFDALAVVRHAGARHRGMPDPGGRDEADCALANLAGQMAGHRVAERGVAGDCRARAFMACCNGARRSCRRRSRKFCASRCWWRAARRNGGPESRKLTRRTEQTVAGTFESNPDVDARICRRSGKQIREQVKADLSTGAAGLYRANGRLIWGSPKIICTASRCNCASNSIRRKEARPARLSRCGRSACRERPMSGAASR